MSNKLITHINLCCQGDTNAFGYIVAEYQQLVYTLAFRLLCDEEDAKDITQETFIKVWQNIAKYKQQYKFSTWIYKMASNACYDKLRKEKKVSKFDSTICELHSTDNPDEQLNNKELKELINNTTKGLPPKQKLIFTLSEFDELEVGEISIITGLTPAKIKSNLYLAKKYIKSKINRYERSKV